MANIPTAHYRPPRSPRKDAVGSVQYNDGSQTTLVSSLVCGGRAAENVSIHTDLPFHPTHKPGAAALQPHASDLTRVFCDTSLALHRANRVLSWAAGRAGGAISRSCAHIRRWNNRPRPTKRTASTASHSTVCIPTVGICFTHDWRPR